MRRSQIRKTSASSNANNDAPIGATAAGNTIRRESPGFARKRGTQEGAYVTRSRQRGRRPQQSTHTHPPNRCFDSSGPEVKIRGSAAHVYEKYLQLARDSNSSGDRVTAENYLQHAEHYYRIMAAQAAQQAQYQAQQAAQNAARGDQGGQPGQGGGGGPNGGQPQQPAPQAPTSAPSFSLAEGVDEDEGEEADAG